MNAETCLKLHQLRHALLASRDRGLVMVEFTDGPSGELTIATARMLGDAMLSLVNVPVMGPHWRQVERMRACDIIAAVLHEDLETQAPRVPQKVAYSLANRVMGFFPGEAIYLTNIRPNADLEQAPHRWASGRRDRELDAGVAIVSENRP